MKNIDLSNRVEDTESVARELIPLNTKISYKNQPNHNDNKKLRDQDAGDFLRKHGIVDESNPSLTGVESIEGGYEGFIEKHFLQEEILLLDTPLKYGKLSDIVRTIYRISNKLDKLSTSLDEGTESMSSYQSKLESIGNFNITMNQAFSFIESQKESLPSEVSLLYKNKIEPLRKLYQQKSTDALTVRVKFKDEKEEKLHTLNVDVTGKYDVTIGWYEYRSNLGLLESEEEGNIETISKLHILENNLRELSKALGRFKGSPHDMGTLIQHGFTSDNLGNLSKIYFKDDNNTLGLDKLDKEFLRQVHEYARLNTAYEANKKSDKTKQE